MPYVVLSRDGEVIIVAPNAAQCAAVLLGRDLSEYRVFREVPVPTSDVHHLIDFWTTCENCEQAGADVYENLTPAR